MFYSGSHSMQSLCNWWHLPNDINIDIDIGIGIDTDICSLI